MNLATTYEIILASLHARKNMLRSDDRAAGAMDGLVNITLAVFAFAILIGIIVERLLAAEAEMTGGYAVLIPVLILIPLVLIFRLVKNAWGGRS